MSFQTDKTDKSVPKRLYDIQKWFGSIITAPLTCDEKIQPITPFGGLIEDESSVYITPNQALKSQERIQIYNQSYWWRLITLLQEAFPFVTHLLGYYDFNQLLAVPYLIDYPPDHWDLNYLGEHLTTWIKNNYGGKGKKRVLHAAELDWKVHLSAYSKKYQALNQNDTFTELPHSVIKLQPSVQLLSFPYDLFLYRKEVLSKEVKYWTDHKLPKLNSDKPHYFILYRSPVHNLEWLEITKGQYSLLKMFQKGTSIMKACQRLESIGGEVYKEAEENIVLWFREWAVNQWLYISL